MDSLEQRVARLEAIEAIRQLKARYLDACDRKQPAEVRACFVDGEMVIDYDRVGELGSADELTALFERFGCEPHIVEMHHAQNPQITVRDEDTASGRWGLYYHLIDTRANTVTRGPRRYRAPGCRLTPATVLRDSAPRRTSAAAR